MHEHGGLAAEFDTHRTHLHAVAYRMLGSPSEADDVVQEAWLRMSRSDVTDVDNLRGWLTTVVARVCLDVLRARRSAHEGSMPHESIDADEPLAELADMHADPGSELLRADAATRLRRARCRHAATYVTGICNKRFRPRGACAILPRRRLRSVS